MALASASIQLNLYKWTTGQLENSDWFIQLLQRRFNPKGNKTLKAYQSLKEIQKNKDTELSDEEDGGLINKSSEDQETTCVEETLSDRSYPYVNISKIIDMNKATVSNLRARVSKMRS